METVRVIVTLPKDRVEKLNELVGKGAAASRNELIDKILVGFLKDLEKSGTNSRPISPESALGALITFFLIVIGAAALAEIFGGKK